MLGSMNYWKSMVMAVDRAKMHAGLSGVTRALAVGLVSLAGSSAFPVDTQNRQDVVDFYHTVYQASQGISMEWNGDVTNCVAGTNSQAYLEATVLRVNYYRAMAGLPGGIALDESLNLKCQEAALMMSAKGSLSHSPDPNWPCYSSGGADAAAHSNLYLGRAGAEAIDGYIDEPGAGNYFVGHRRWILYPPQQAMGSGSTPQVPYHLAANSLWVIGSFGPRPPQPEWVAWPPRGFVPFQVLPRRSGRWSFAYPNADLANATVTMQRTGTNVVLTPEKQENSGGYADNTLVWRPDGIPYTSPSGDVAFSVSVSNVLVAGVPHVFTYTVTVIDPDLSPPTLAYTRSGTELWLSWPLAFTNAVLEAKQNISAVWAPLAGEALETNGQWMWVRQATNATEFYRLRWP